MERSRRLTFTYHEIAQLSALVTVAIEHNAGKSGKHDRHLRDDSKSNTKDASAAPPTDVNNEHVVKDHCLSQSPQRNEIESTQASANSRDLAMNTEGPAASQRSFSHQCREGQEQRKQHEDGAEHKQCKALLWGGFDVNSLMQLVNKALAAHKQSNSESPDSRVRSVYSAPVTPARDCFPSPFLQMSPAGHVQAWSSPSPKMRRSLSLLPARDFNGVSTGMINENPRYIGLEQSTNSTPQLESDETFPSGFDDFDSSNSLSTNFGSEESPVVLVKRQGDPTASATARPRKIARTKASKSLIARRQLGSDPNRPGLVTLLVRTPLSFGHMHDPALTHIKLVPPFSVPHLSTVESEQRPIDMTPVHTDKSAVAIPVPHSYPHNTTPAREYMISKLDPHMKDLLNYLATTRPERPFAAAAAFLKNRSEHVEGPWEMEDAVLDSSQIHLKEDPSSHQELTRPVE